VVLLLGEFEIGRQDTDHCVRSPAENDLSSGHGRIRIEPPAPDRVSEHHNLVLSGVILFLVERTAQSRMYAQYVEEIRRYLSPRNQFRTAIASQACGDVSIRPESLQRACAFAPLDKLTQINRQRPAVAELGCRKRNRSESLRIREVQRPQEDSAYEREDRRVGADPDREAEHSGSR